MLNSAFSKGKNEWRNKNADDNVNNIKETSEKLSLKLYKK